MARRLGLLAAAIALALFGAFALLSYAGQPRAAQATTAVVDEAPVLIVQKAVPAGTAAADVAAYVKADKLPRKAVPAAAVLDLKTVADRVVGQDLSAGEVLLSSNFVSKDVAGSIKIPNDKLAISVQLADPQRVAGFVLPGSNVAVFDTYGGSGAGQTTRLLLPKVQVIAVGPTALQTVGGSTGAQATKAADTGASALLTLAVDQPQALKVIHASQTGKLTFALLSDASHADGAQASVDDSNLFN